MFGLGQTEIILIFLAILLLFGGKKLPEFARGLGKGIKEFRRAKDEIDEELEDKDDKVERLPGKKAPHETE